MVSGPKSISYLSVCSEACRPLGPTFHRFTQWSQDQNHEGEAAFSSYAPLMWNKLPEYLRSVKTIILFK